MVEIMQNPATVPDSKGRWFELYNVGERMWTSMAGGLWIAEMTFFCGQTLNCEFFQINIKEIFKRKEYLNGIDLKT